MDPLTFAAGVGTILVSLITIIGSMYGMLKFMLKDVHKEVELLKEQQNKFSIEMLHVNNRLDGLQNKFSIEMLHVNNRLDGLYRVILERTYGKNIPDDLK